MDEFIIKIIIAAIGISLITSALGCFVVWKKMAYFGDSLAHASLLGIAIGIIFAIDINLMILVITICFALILGYLQNKNILSNDALLGILAHGGISLAMVVVSFSHIIFNLEGFLFGSLLFVENEDIFLIYTALFIIYPIIFYNWQKFILLTLNSDIACAMGINPSKYRMIFTILIALTITITIKITGVLLVTSLLIIPASIARIISKSPNQMLFFSALISVFASICGCLLSYKFDLILGPIIIAITIVVFILVVMVKISFNHGYK
jgi:zinc transport system permease protein